MTLLTIFTAIAAGIGISIWLWLFVTEPFYSFKEGDIDE